MPFLELKHYRFRRFAAHFTSFLQRVARGTMILPIRFYQCAISPLIGPNCRFTPTCSAYFILAVEKYGAVRGTLKGIARILRCHPFHPGGEDWP